METNKKDEQTDKKNLPPDGTIDLECAFGFMILKNFENVILLQEKGKKLAKGMDITAYDKFFNEMIKPNDENSSILITTNSKNNLFPISSSAMRHSMAAVMAEYNKTMYDDKIKESATIKPFLVEIKNILALKNLTFQDYFFSNSPNEILYETNPVQISSEKLFEEKYTFTETEFREKLNDLVTTEAQNINKLIDMIIIGKQNKGNFKVRKVDALRCYYLIYAPPVKYSLTNLVLFGEFAERCRLEFQNSTKEQIMLLNKRRDKIFEDRNIYELPIKSLPILDVKIGDNHIIIQNIDGELFSWGDGSAGATGNGIRTFHIIPTKIQFIQREKKLLNKEIKILKIACGSRHCLALTTTKSVFSWGFGKNGRLGHGDTRDQFEPRLIDFFENTKIEKVFAADNYSSIVSCAGALFTWGAGEFGRLGHEEYRDENLPKIVNYFKSDILDAKCGYYCMLVLRKSDLNNLDLYCMGGKTLFSSKIETDENTGDYPFLKDDTLEGKIKKIEYSFPNKKRNLLKFSSGFHYISLLTEDVKIKESDENNDDRIKLFVWGNFKMDNLTNTRGKKFNLINEDINSNYDYETPTGESVFESDKNNENKNLLNLYLNEMKNQKINSDSDKGELENKKIKSVLCSDNNTIILSSDGNVYAFGSSEYKIAKSNIEEYVLPIQINGLKIEAVALGKEHVIVVTKNFEVYGWGRNNEGQLGLGDGSMGIRDTPTYIDKLKNLGVNKVYARENYSTAIDINKKIHIFGDLHFLENDGNIGKKFIPKQMHEWGEIEYFACGPSHFVFMRELNGEFSLKSVGNGTFGKLGYDPEKDDNKSEPVDVKIDKEIIDKIYSNSDEFEKEIKIVCSRKQTIFLIKYLKDKKFISSKIFTWGLIHNNLFSQADKEKILKSKKTQKVNLVPNGYLVQNSPYSVLVKKFDDIIDVELTDSIFYFINSNYELEFYGDLNTKYEEHDKCNKDYYLNKNFEKIFVGRDHALALNTTGKLFSWGNNNFKKCGIKHENLPDYNDDEENNIYKKFFHPSPQELKEFNIGKKDL